MHCPKCGHSEFLASAPCPVCDYHGPADLLETLSHLDFLLNDIATWQDLPPYWLEKFRQRYTKRQRALEVELELRPPPLDAEAAAAARLELEQHTTLIKFTSHWEAQGLLSSETVAALNGKSKARIESLQDRLVDAPETEPPKTEVFNLEQLHFLQHTLEALRMAGDVLDGPACEAALADLEARIQRLEIALGLRLPAAPSPEVKKTPAGRVRSSPEPARKLRPALTWERVWETLLSERTLQAMLFLGAGLLFAAAVSLVVWNWQAFPPWLQVTFLALFTGIFYGLGYFVRTRLKLRGSGIALSAVASLLVPLDFYAIYLSGGFLQESWPQVWLLASVVCLGAYLLTASLVQAEFFGYLVGLAAGSTLAATLQIANISIDWWQSALSGLGLALALLAEGLHRRQTGRWKVLALPLWRVSLLSATVILAINLGWWLSQRSGEQTFQVALSLSLWLSGLTFTLGAWRFRSRSISIAAAASFPVAVLFGQDVLFHQWGLSAAWKSLGLAALAPLYLWIGRRLEIHSTKDVFPAHARTAIRTGVLLMLFAGIWSLIKVDIAAAVHLLLAVTVVLAISLWRRPNLTFFASLLLLTSSAALIASQGAIVAQVGLAWALLAILHVIFAVRLGKVPEGLSNPPPRGSYARPLYTAGWAIAGLALLPPLVSFEHGIFTYALGNWVALNGWLALLAHSAEASVVVVFPARKRRTLQPAPTLFHWSAALPIPLWVWMIWTQRLPADAPLGLSLTPLAIGLLFGGAWLRGQRRSYGLPWMVAAHISLLVGLLAGVRFYDQPWMAATLLLGSVYYFAVAHTSHQRLWLLPCGVLLPIGWLLLLDWLHLANQAMPAALSMLSLAYILVAGILERRRQQRRAFLAPLYWLAQAIAATAFVWSMALLIPVSDGEPQYLWAAAADLLLALSLGAHAWLLDKGLSAHIAAWLGAVAGGLLALNFSHGSGRSAVLASLGAMVYIFSERGLLWASKTPGLSLRWRPYIRQAWRLYRRPLLVVGWSVSAAAIFMALVRNLAILGGGQRRELWSTASLALLCGLYAAAAHLFRRQWKTAHRLVWLTALLLPIPWTLLGVQLWRSSLLRLAGFAILWALLALLELLGGSWLGQRLKAPYQTWGTPPQVVAHLLMPFALLWGLGDAGVSSLTFGLASAFYLLAVNIDLRQGRLSARFLYPAAFSTSLWAIYMLAHLAPQAPQTAFGALLLGLALPALLLGKWIERRRGVIQGRSFALPLYLVTYLGLLAGTALVGHERPPLIAALSFDTLMLGFSAWSFRQPLWIYPGSATLPAAVVLALIEWNVPAARYGWALIAVGGLYLGVAYWLERAHRDLTDQETHSAGQIRQTYALPLIVAAFALIALGLPNSSIDRPGAIIGYSGAALLYTWSAAWLRQPLLVTPAVGLAIVPYWLSILESGIEPHNYSLALWPGILLALSMATILDYHLGIEAGDIEPFPWFNPVRWPWASAERLARWWALPLYTAAYLGAASSALLSFNDPARLTPILSLTAAIFTHAIFRFHLRGWLLAAATCTQLAALTAIRWANLATGWPGDEWIALAFTPLTWLAALVGLYIQARRGEEPPLGTGWVTNRPIWERLWRGWSRPLFLLALIDLLVVQTASFTLNEQSAWVSLSHALLLGLLASAWASSLLAYPALVLGILALLQRLAWAQAPETIWPWALSLLALAYGLPGYLLRYMRLRKSSLPVCAGAWEQPLCRGGWLVSVTSLVLALAVGLDVVTLIVRAILGRPPLSFEDIANVRMIVGVLAVLGLFYLAAAVTDRRRWLGYGALASLLCAWSVELLLIQDQREFQWYAIPAGIYLLGVGYLEWKLGSRQLARWIDRAAILLLLGSSFWQSWGEQGGVYALIMGLEGLLLLWWGSARRLRRFLYAGVGGVSLDVASQLIEPLLSANRWIVFGVAGLILVGLAILVERRLETVRGLSQAMRERLETWE